MPELCRFYGVRIKMYYDDHNPPHFHAEYAGDEALITIDTLDVMAGELPSRALGLVYEWAGKHRAELEKRGSARRTWSQLERLSRSNNPERRYNPTLLPTTGWSQFLIVAPLPLITERLVPVAAEFSRYV